MELIVQVNSFLAVLTFRERRPTGRRLSFQAVARALASNASMSAHFRRIVIEIFFRVAASILRPSLDSRIF